MGMRYISNAFSLNMLAQKTSTIRTRPVPLGLAKVLAGHSYSAVGHADTAAVMEAELGMEVPFNRASLVLQPGDELLVGQYSGPRLEEGCKALPVGAKIEWILVEVHL